MIGDKYTILRRRCPMDLTDFEITPKEHVLCDFNLRFKGGKAKMPNSNMPMTDNMSYAMDELYPMVERGMSGEGYGTEYLTNQRIQASKEGLADSFKQTKGELNSQISRTINSQDSRVSNYLGSSLSKAYTSTQDDIRKSYRAEAVGDKDMSMGMASDYLASEKRMTISGAQAYNQAAMANQQQEQQYGTFGTNLAGGLGSGMMDYMYSRQMAK